MAFSVCVCAKYLHKRIHIDMIHLFGYLLIGEPPLDIILANSSATQFRSQEHNVSIVGRSRGRVLDGWPGLGYGRVFCPTCFFEF